MRGIDHSEQCYVSFLTSGLSKWNKQIQNSVISRNAKCFELLDQVHNLLIRIMLGLSKDSYDILKCVQNVCIMKPHNMPCTKDADKYW